MIINMKEDILKAMREQYPDNPVFEESEERWNRDKNVDSKFMNKDEVESLLGLYELEENKKQIEDRRQARKLRSLLKLMSGSAKKIVNLQDIAEALKMYMQDLPRHWLFEEDTLAEALVPYFINEIQYHAATRQGSEAYVSLKGEAMYRGGRTTLNRSIRRENLGAKGCSASELLDYLNLFPENDELVAEHKAEVEKYMDMVNETGLQLVGRGRCEVREDRWSNRSVSLDKGGIISKLVVDDQEERKDKASSDVVSTDLWSVKLGSDGEEKDVHKLPIHPYMRAFSLKMHEFVNIHVKNVDKYIYEEGLDDKLVLADDKRELINLLVSSGGDDSRDIVQGKSGGVIIITSGPPGTGKTLTSEVFSEKVKRPLYVVQCSQLGTNSDKLEEKLNVVLERATRWNAVLLIDEADVYIHERGDNIHQNAVVGVFLRLLEYYSGVLFLTTNRECVIDDAIMSRAIAHIRYTMPEDEEREALWSILSEQYGTPFEAEMCKELAMTFRGISGRSVKQLIRLSKALSVSRGEELTIETIVWVARFQPIETNGTEEITLRDGRKFPVMKTRSNQDDV